MAHGSYLSKAVKQVGSVFLREVRSGGGTGAGAAVVHKSLMKLFDIETSSRDNVE